MSTIQFKGNKDEIKNGFPVAPEGDYFVTCVEVKERTSKRGGHPQVELELVIAQGEFADKVHVWDYVTFIPAGEPGHGMALHALHAFGLPYDGDVEVDLQAFRGVTVKARLEQDTYQGKLKNIIGEYYVLEDAEMTKEAFGDPEPAPVRQSAPPPARQAPSTAAPKGKLPWMNKR